MGSPKLRTAIKILILLLGLAYQVGVQASSTDTSASITSATETTTTYISSTSTGTSSPTSLSSTSTQTSSSTSASTSSTQTGSSSTPDSTSSTFAGSLSSPASTSSTLTGSSSTIDSTSSTLAGSSPDSTSSTLAGSSSSPASTSSTFAGSSSTPASTASTLTGSSSTIGSTSSTLAGSSSTPAGSSSATTVSTTPKPTTVPTPTENEILEGIKLELENIKSSLEDLSRFINSLFTTSPPATTTVAMKIGHARGHARNVLKSSKAEEVICTPIDESEADPCYHLIYLLDEIQSFTTQFMSQEDVGPEELQQIQDYEQQLNSLVEEIKMDDEFIYAYKVNADAFNDRIADVTDGVDSAIDEAEARIIENNESNLSDPEILVIVISTVCGVMILALIILAVHVGVKNAKLRKMKKMNVVPDPTHATETGGYDNMGLVAEESFFERPQQGPSSGGIPMSFANEGYPSRSHHAEVAAHRNPHQEPPVALLPRVAPPSRWSNGDGSRPTSPHGSVMVHPRAGSSAHVPVYDPYSLENRGANVKRVTSGGLRRQDH